MIGQNSKKIWSTAMKRAMEELDEAKTQGSVKTENVLYDDLISDPIGTIKQLYDSLGYNFSKEFETRLEEYIRMNKEERKKMQGAKKKLHSYSAEEYGLTNEELEEAFKEYHDKFGVSKQRRV